MSRAVSRAVLGAALALGAPLGWLLIQALKGVAVREELTQHPGLYLYMLVGTGAVFGLFGFLLGEREARLENLAVTDSLTGLRNARYFHTRLAEEWAEHERTGSPLAVAVIDLDHFKAINDRFGHQVGDDVLVSTARAIAATTRHGETEARVGGEEFALLLPNSAGEQASEVAERVRRAIGAATTRVAGTDGGIVRVTASAGVASVADVQAADADALYRAADEALYRAKREGRDRTVVAGTPE